MTPVECEQEPDIPLSKEEEKNGSVPFLVACARGHSHKKPPEKAGKQQTLTTDQISLI